MTKIKISQYINDVAWSTMAVLMMNVVQQFILYPILRNILGLDTYGDVLYLIGFLNIIAIPLGTSLGQARIKATINSPDNPKVYERILFCSFIIIIPLAFSAFIWGDLFYTPVQVFFYWILICLTAYRIYASVEYRIIVNYKRFFLYYFTITLGYLIGIVVFYFTHIWFAILMVGELFGCIFVNVSRIHKKECIKKDTLIVKNALKSVFTLLGAQILVNIVFNADRLVLKTFVGSSAVSIYYISALIGKTVSLVTDPINNVLIGHLVKSGKNLSGGTLIKITCGIITASIPLTMFCCFVSNIFILLFYPNEYQEVRPLLFLANFAQILYFASSLEATILLRYIKEKFQFIINFLYVISFLLIVVPLTCEADTMGFALAMCVVNFLRIVYCTIIGFFELKRILNLKIS